MDGYCIGGQTDGWTDGWIMGGREGERRLVCRNFLGCSIALGPALCAVKLVFPPASALPHSACQGREGVGAEDHPARGPGVTRLYVTQPPAPVHRGPAPLPVGVKPGSPGPVGSHTRMRMVTGPASQAQRGFRGSCPPGTTPGKCWLFFLLLKETEQADQPRTGAPMKTHGEIHTVEYYSPVNRNEALPHTTVWMNCEKHCAGETRQVQKTTFFFF